MKTIRFASSLASGAKKIAMGKTYDGIHRISFLIDADGKIEHVFDDFKTSNHHDVVLNWLKENA